MTEMHSTIDRLEARIDYQAARIDALYALLQARGVLPRPVNNGRADAAVDDLLNGNGTRVERDDHAPTPLRPPSRLRLGSATGV